MALKLGMTVNIIMHGIYAYARFDDPDLDTGHSGLAQENNI